VLPPARLIVGSRHQAIDLALGTDERVRAGKPVSPAFLFATLLWHEVLASWNAAKTAGERPIPALFVAMDRILEQQAERLAIPRRFEATIKETWALQPRFEQRAGQRPFRLLEHPRFRAGYDFLRLRAESGEIPVELAHWWERFQRVEADERAAMLRADEAPRKRRRPRGRKKRPGAEIDGPEPQSPPDTDVHARLRPGSNSAIRADSSRERVRNVAAAAHAWSRRRATIAARR
jgi:hypothetical protein